MPRTENILGHLPGTFVAGADPSALRAFVGAFGGELQRAENGLAAVMRSHWADLADQGVDEIRDLACIGALYGLLPRGDETVEEFREHLLRYVATFLDGTVTVEGLLRVTAETLHLPIVEPVDAWWDRTTDMLTTSLPSGADAATTVLGTATATATGADPEPAVVVGEPDLRTPRDLRAAPTLWLALDGGGSVPTDLTDQAADPAAVTAEEVVGAIDAVHGPGLADLVDGRLRLTSTTTGPDASIEVVDGPGDAAPIVLGLPPRTHTGADATRATIVGTTPLSPPLDLTDVRYLRIDVDGDLAEIDLAATAADAGAVTLDELVAAIDAATGASVASHDGIHLTLTSPTPGAAGHLAVLAAAAQDAAPLVLGEAPRLALGTDARPAQVRATVDTGAGVDLTGRSTVRLAVDGEPPVDVDVAGGDPTTTLPAEIVTSLNAGVGATVASHDGRFVTLRSPTVGEDGLLELGEVPGDAVPAILGTPSRLFRGTPARTAAITGAVDLTEGADLRARHLLELAVDSAAPVRIDLRRHAEDLTAVTPDQLATAIDDALEAEVATHDGAHLVLVSPTTGAGGAVEVTAVIDRRDRRFVTRAVVDDDAASRLLGMAEAHAVGSDPTAARLAGVADLLAGVDLRDGGHLRVRLDGDDPVEVDVTGPRPRATTAAEVVAALSDALGPGVAATDGHVVVLVSRTTGPDSSIELEPTTARDATGPLGLTPGRAQGTDATGVHLVGTTDLSAGVDLPVDGTIAVGVDGATPVEVLLGTDPATTRTLSQLVGTLNARLAAPVASHDGAHLHLVSPSRGSGASLTVAVPSSGTDVTDAVLGVTPRTYVGREASAAEIEGTVELTATRPLGRARHLRLAVDRGEPVTVDLGAVAGDPADPAPGEVTAAITAATNAAATLVDGRLRLASPTTGSASRLTVEQADVGDARAAVFGPGPWHATGDPARPAEVVGDVDLLAPVDLTDATVLRLAIDGGPVHAVDVGGGTPSATVLSEVVAAVEEMLPGVAAATEDARLRLRSPTTGTTSNMSVRPLRQLELQEYPPGPVEHSTTVRHGGLVAVDNSGAATAALRLRLDTALGTVAPAVADPDRRWSVRVDVAVDARAALELEQVEGTVHARIVDPPDRPGGGSHDVDPDAIRVAGEPDAVLRLPRGRTRLLFTECVAARFDHARFDEARFPGPPCARPGVFDATAFSDPPDVATVFADPALPRTEHALDLGWEEHGAGALVVNLPTELDERYGAAFGTGRFGAAAPETFAGVVTEPIDDPAYLLTVVNDRSGLVEARLADRVPIGWSPVELPFRHPAPLTLGTATRSARLYLAEPGLDGRFVELEAREPGTWANEVTVTARASGPAIYDLEVHYPGGRIEAARAVVAGWPPVDLGDGDPVQGCALAPAPPLAETTGLPTLAAELLAAGPVGVLQAKAAGVHAAVTRDRARDPAASP